MSTSRGFALALGFVCVMVAALSSPCQGEDLGVVTGTSPQGGGVVTVVPGKEGDYHLIQTDSVDSQGNKVTTYQAQLQPNSSSCQPSFSVGSGQDYEYIDKDGKRQTLKVTDSNTNKPAFDHLQSFATATAGTLTPTVALPGTAIYALLMPLSNQSEFFTGFPPPFGNNPILTPLTFFSINASTSQLSILGSATQDGLTPELLTINPASLGLDLVGISGTPAQEAMFLRVTTTPGQILTSGDNLIITAGVPEPSSLVLILFGGLGLLATKRFRQRAQCGENELLEAPKIVAQSAAGVPDL